MLIRKQLTVLSETGNEYAQQVLLKLPDGKTATINNVYLPPACSLRKRKIPEEKARSAVLDIVTAAPVADHVITVGDFNTRTGTLAPRVGDV